MACSPQSNRAGSPASTALSTISLDTCPSSMDAHSENPVYLHACTAYSFGGHLSTVKSIDRCDFRNEKAIIALPLRKNKSQRPLAIQLAQAHFTGHSELAALVEYERITTKAKKIVREKERARHAAHVYPKNNVRGKLLKIQGPWAGQGIDPVSLKGPAAIPMPVTIGSHADFKPMFDFLKFLGQDKPFPKSVDSTDNSIANSHILEKRGVEIMWKIPMVEFERGIVYEDGRLDLCKQGVGPTHIGKLMESLHSNHQIRHFLLGNNVTSTTGANEIALFINKHPDRMETWYVAGCHITKHGLSLLVPEMVKSSAITNLWFKRNPFGPQSSSLLADLVLRTRNLRTLDLETVELGDEGTGELMDSICGQKSPLRHIYLNANGIGKYACASIARYLGNPVCALESLFLSTNPIGDAGMRILAPGIEKNTSLKRLMFASTGLTSTGVILLSTALSNGDCPLQVLDLSASMTTIVHGQRFNYFDDDCIESLQRLLLLPRMRWLDIGRTVFSAAGLQDIMSAVAFSELVYFSAHRVEITGGLKNNFESKATMYNGTPVKSCSLEFMNRMAINQAKNYPHIASYHEFLKSDEYRSLRNTDDVRKVDSMYRTRDKRLGLPIDSTWKEGDDTWRMIVEDAQRAEGS